MVWVAIFYCQWPGVPPCLPHTSGTPTLAGTAMANPLPPPATKTSPWLEEITQKIFQSLKDWGRGRPAAVCKRLLQFWMVV
jgi:hypothetical protein